MSVEVNSGKKVRRQINPKDPSLKPILGDLLRANCEPTVPCDLRLIRF